MSLFALMTVPQVSLPHVCDFSAQERTPTHMRRFGYHRSIMMIAGITLFAASLVHGQQESSTSHEPDAHQVFRMVKTECAGDADCMLEAGRDLLNSQDCARREVGFCIVFQVEPGLQRALASAEGSECDVSFWPYHYLKGNWMFESGFYEEALTEYVAAEQEGMEPPLTTYTNMGATYFALQDWEAALTCLEQAWELRNEGDAPGAYMILNNLAAIHLRFHEYDEALIWVDKAKMNFEELSGAGYGFTPKDLSAARLLIDMNEWFARCALGDTAFVQDNWRNLNWGALEVQPRDWFKLMGLVAPLVTDEEFWSAQSRTLASVLDELNPDLDEWGRHYGAYALLIYQNMYFPGRYDNLAAMWKSIAELQGRQHHGTTPQQAGSLGWGFVPMAVCGVLLLTWLLFERRLHTARQLRLRSSEQLLNRLGEIASRGTGWGEAGVLLDALVAQFPNALNAQSVIEQYNLTDSEVEVLISAQLRESPKDLARRKSWTPKYVYSMRSSLRKKLGVPAEMPLEEWFNHSKQ